ncbi:MAG: OmpA family protein, partial [Thermodesulfobacteriota bacterium]
SSPSGAVTVNRQEDILIASLKSDKLFNPGSDALKPSGRDEVARIANVLKQYPETLIKIEGHTGSGGSEVANQRLSERHAEAVKDALVGGDINPNRIVTLGLGESDPTSSDDSLNRRVNIIIIPVKS